MNNYQLVVARSSHLKAVYRLCMKALKEGPDGHLQFDQYKVKNTIHMLIEDPHQLAVLAITEGHVKGLVLGMVSPHAYASGLVAEDIALYVAPRLRGSDCYKDLAAVYDDWCDRIPQLVGRTLSLSRIGPTTPVMESLYKGMGYKKGGVTYMKVSNE
jgi:hypothetical protein